MAVGTKMGASVENLKIGASVDMLALTSCKSNSFLGVFSLSLSGCSEIGWDIFNSNKK